MTQPADPVHAIVYMSIATALENTEQAQSWSCRQSLTAQLKLSTACFQPSVSIAWTLQTCDMPIKTNTRPLDDEFIVHVLHNHSIAPQTMIALTYCNKALSGALRLLVETPDGSVCEAVQNHPLKEGANEKDRPERLWLLVAVNNRIISVKSQCY